MFLNKFSSLIIATVLFCLTANNAFAVILVQVSSLSNMTLPNWSLGDPDVNGHIDVCIYSTLTANYNVAVSSPSGFNLTNGINNIPFSLSWDAGGVGNLGNSAGTQLSNGVSITNQGGANFVSPICLTGPNARLNLKITQAAMTAALAGAYTGTINITISPY